MRRFEPVIVYKTADMSESTDGLYVLHSEAKAEIDRLRGLVEKAHLEGVRTGENREAMNLFLPEELWGSSDARKFLTPPSPTHNQQ